MSGGLSPRVFFAASLPRKIRFPFALPANVFPEIVVSSRWASYATNKSFITGRSVVSHEDVSISDMLRTVSVSLGVTLKAPPTGKE